MHLSETFCFRKREPICQVDVRSDLDLTAASACTGSLVTLARGLSAERGGNCFGMIKLALRASTSDHGCLFEDGPRWTLSSGWRLTRTPLGQTVAPSWSATRSAFSNPFATDRKPARTADLMKKQLAVTTIASTSKRPVQGA